MAFSGYECGKVIRELINNIYLFFYMIFEKLAIITDGKETTCKVVELFAPYMAVNIYELLCYDIILVDSNIGIDDWTEIIKEDLGVDVKVMLIEDLKFTEDAPNYLQLGITKFIKKADISDDINHYLDLILEKGSKYRLYQCE